MLTVVLASFTAMGHFRLIFRLRSARRLGGGRTVETVQIVLRDISLRPPTQATSMTYPSKLRRADTLEIELPDFGDLIIRIPEDKSQRLDRRVFQHEFQHDLAYENIVNWADDEDSVDGYFPFK